jgi:hypothetical protein
MFERLKSKTAVATVASLVAALGVGGVALAQNNSGNATPAQKANPVTQVQGQQSKAKNSSAAKDSSATDSDNVQSGDQSAPDTGSAQEPAGTETNDASGEQPGSETNDASGEQSGSEVSNNDGPAGHADEPGNANADHQAQGQE